MKLIVNFVLAHVFTNNGTRVTCAHIATNFLQLQLWHARLEPAAGCACTESALAGNQIKLSEEDQTEKEVPSLMIQ